MKVFKSQKQKVIFIIISIPVLIIAQYYLFKFGILRPMVKGAEIEIVGGEYVKDIDKYVVKLNDTVTLSTGKYIKIPSYAKDANIWFNVLDDSGILKIEGNKMIAMKEGFSSIGIMKNSRVLKKATIRVVNPKVEKLDIDIDGNIEYVGDTAQINSIVEVDYKKFQKNYKVNIKSSDENILKVEGDKLRAVGVGTAVLTANSGDKKVNTTFRINAWVTDIGIDKNIEVEVGQMRNLDPDIKTSPKGLKHPKVKYDFVDRKLPVARAISLSEDGQIVALRKGEESVRVTCGNKSKVVNVNVVEESLTNDSINNLEYTYEIVDGKMLINLSWDHLKGVEEYEVFLRNKLEGNNFYKVKSVKVDNGKIERIKTTVEVELKDTKNISLDMYVIGKTKVGDTKPSKIINIKVGDNNSNDLSNMEIEGLEANIDLDNNVINLNWNPIEKYNCTYSVYVRNNTKGESTFTIQKQGIQENTSTISIPEGELNLDIYVIAKYNGVSSQKSNIVNIR